MRDLTEESDDIEIHVSFTREELRALVNDLDHYSDSGKKFIDFLKGKLNN